MGNGRHVSNIDNFITHRIQGAYRGFTTRPRPLDVDLQVLHTKVLRRLAGFLRSDLRRKGGAFSRSAKAAAPGSSPREDVSLPVGNGDDGIIK